MPSADTIGALLALAFAAAWTPGPNNAMLAASGATFGFRRTLPHALGVTLGFPAMVFLVALGLGRAFQESEALRETLRWGGAALLLWIAWRIATAKGPGGGKGRAKPFSFLQAAAFQWVNPKAWAMCVAVVAQYASGTAPGAEALTCAAVFLVAGATSTHGWAGFGAAIGRLLGSGLRLRVFNLVMAAMVAAGVALLIAADLGPS